MELSSRECPIHTHIVSCNHEVAPTLSTILKDLLSFDNGTRIDVVDYVQLENTQASSHLDIVASIMEAPGVTNWDDNPRPRLLSALSIPSKPKGLGACSLSLPADMLQTSVYPVAGKGENARPEWLSCLSPMGAITAPHKDYHGSSQVMYHISGEKLWMLWPPTPNNLLWYGKRRDRTSTTNRTVEAIREMEGMTVLHVKDPIGFSLPPYGIHAVITFSASSHAGIRVWGYDWIDEAFPAIINEIEWAGNAASNRIPASDGIEILQDILAELKNWDRLLKEKGMHGRADYASQLLAEARKKAHAKVSALTKQVSNVRIGNAAGEKY